MPSSTKNIQSQNYFQRVLSSSRSKNGTDLNANSGELSNYSRLNDELRNRIHYLKTELDAERSKSKQTHRNKVVEIKRMRDDLESDYQLNLEASTIKITSVKEMEIRKLRDSLSRDKELEIKQIIKYKDEEIRTLRRTMLEEKEQALRDAEETHSQQLSAKSSRSANDDTLRKLKQELSELKRTRDTLEECCKQHLSGLNEKNDVIKNLKSEHERELQRVLRETRRENSRSLSEMQQLKKTLTEKTVEANKLSVYAERVVTEKEELLSDKIRQDRMNISSERSLLTMSTLDVSSRPLSPRMDNDLQSKNADLRRQLDVSSKKIKLLEKEMSNLTLHSTTQSSEATSISIVSDKRIKELKRRNAELVQIAKKLEDRTKNTQKELDKTKNQLDDSKSSSQNMNSLKKSFAIQRAKDLAKHASLVALKEKEMEELKQSFETSTHEEQLMFKAIENSLQVAARERLRLEHQLMTSPTNRENKDVLEEDKEHITHIRTALDEITIKYSKQYEDLQNLNEKYENRDTEYNTIVKEYQQLQLKHAQIDTEYMELKQKHEVCFENEKMLKEKSRQLVHLSNELKNKEEECVALSKSLLNKDQEMNTLRKQMKEKELECKQLIKTSNMLKSNVKTLEENLREIKKQLHAMDKLRQEYSALENELRETNDHCESMLININQLENEIQHLKNVTEQQRQKINDLEINNSRLNDQLHSKDISINKMKNEMKNLSDTHHKTISSLEERLKGYEEKINHMKISSSTKQIQTDLIPFKNIAIQTDNVLYLPKASTAHNSLVDNVFEDTLGFTPKQKISSSSMLSDPGLSEISIRSDDILERINQLAVSQSDVSVTESISEYKKQDVSIPFDEQATDDEEDLLEPVIIDEQNALLQSDFYSLTPGKEIQSEQLNTEVSQQATDKQPPDIIKGYTNNKVEPPSELQEETNAIKGETTLPEEIQQNDNIDDFGTPHEISVLYKRYMENFNGNNPIKLFKSSYTYDPLLYSPNEDAHLELPLHLGMYIYVYGDMDEDGFYLAELRNGKRGLVPSNLIQLVQDDSFETNEDGSLLDEDLSEAKTLLIQKTALWNAQKLGLEKTDIPIAAEYLSTTDALKSSQTSLTPHIDSLLFESEPEDEISQLEEVFVCSPRNIKIERQLNNSVVVAWKAPEDLHDVKGYAIYMNGIIKQTVLGSARTKALVSDILSDQTYRISVHTVKFDGSESKDEQAVLTLGKGTAFAPYDVTISKLTSTSAYLSWKPSYSSHYHMIYVNNEETSKLQPGVYKYMFTRLHPDTFYAIKVQSRVALHEEPSSEWNSTLNFQTLQGNKPEPPLNVQFHIKDNLLHVSWIPVTINECGTSNGSIVLGYKIYLNNEERGLVNSPTTDHLVIPFDKTICPGNSLSVFIRTLSSGGESESSDQVTLDMKTLESTLQNEKNILQTEDEIIPQINKQVQNVNNNFFHQIEQLDDVPNQMLEPYDVKINKSHVLLDIDDGDLWQQDVDDSYKNDADPLVEPTEEDRIVISDEDLSIIKEESEIELLTYERTRAERTENIEANSGGTLLDISSDNKIFSSDQSDEKNRTVILSDRYKVKDTGDNDISITENISDDVDSIEFSSEDLQYDPMNESFDTESLRLNKLKDKMLKDSYNLLESETKDSMSNVITDDGISEISHKIETESIQRPDIPSHELMTPLSLNEEHESASESLAIEPIKKLTGQTYSIHKSSSVDENHNKTFSFNSYNNNTIPPPVKQDVLLSSAQLDTVDMIDMLEKDAQRNIEPIQHNEKDAQRNTQPIQHLEKDPHRDILEDYPELPLDNDDSKSLLLEASMVKERFEPVLNNETSVSTKESFGDESIKNELLKIHELASMSDEHVMSDTDSPHHLSEKMNVYTKSLLEDESEGEAKRETHKLISLSDLTSTEDFSKLSSIDFEDPPLGDDTSNDLHVPKEPKDIHLLISASELTSTEDLSKPSIILESTSLAHVEAKGAAQSSMGPANTSSDHIKAESLSKPISSSNLCLTEDDSSDIDEDSIDTGSGLPLSSLQLSSIAASHDTDPTNQLSSINISESNDPDIEQLLNVDILKLSELPRDDSNSMEFDQREIPDEQNKPVEQERQDLKRSCLPSSTGLLMDDLRDVESKSIDTPSIDMSSVDLPSEGKVKIPNIAVRRLSVEYSKDSLEASDILSPGRGRHADDTQSYVDEKPLLSDHNEVLESEEPIIDTPDVKHLTDSLITSDEESLSRSVRRSLNFDNDNIDHSENTEQDISQSVSITNEPNLPETNPIPTPMFDSCSMLPSDFSLPQHETITGASVDFQFAQSNSETEKSESFVIPKPLKNLYALGHVDISSNENSVTERDVSEISDSNEDEFDVTPINALDDDSNDSKFLEADTSDKTDAKDHSITSSVKVKEMVGNIEQGPGPSIDHEKIAKEIDKQTKVRIFIAMYPYNPLTMSPNVNYIDDELSFEEGALIKVYGDVDEDGFLFGELDGVTGMVPSNMVSEIDLGKHNTFMKNDKDVKNVDKEKPHEDSHSETQNKTDSFDVSFMVERKQKDLNTSISSNLATASSTNISNTTSNLFATKSQSYQNINNEKQQHDNVDSSRNKSVSMPDVYLQESTNQRLDPYKLHAQRMIAMFDYDPNVSSPNVDAEIELAFRSGEIVYVYGEMDEDGFYAKEIWHRMKSMLSFNDNHSLIYDGNVLAFVHIGYLHSILQDGMQVAYIHKDENVIIYGSKLLDETINKRCWKFLPTEQRAVIYRKIFLLKENTNGKINGRKGLIPSNFVRETRNDDKKMATASTESPKVKKKSSFLKKSKKIFSKFKGGK